MSVASVRRTVLALTLMLAPAVQAADMPAPQFKLDTSWPKLPLPHEWALASIGGIYADAKDHIWVYHSPRILANNVLGAAQTPKRGNCCVPGPFVIEHRF